MSLHTITGHAVERNGVILMARILGLDGKPITQASVSAMSYEVGYRGTPEENKAPNDNSTQPTPVRTSTANIAITVADAVYDTLQTGPTWLVTAAAPYESGTTLYVDPLRGDLPVGRLLQFPSGSARVTSVARTGDRQVSATITGTIGLGQKAIAGTGQIPPASPWKVDDTGYNFRLDLPATELAEIPMATYPEPRFYVVSIKATPTVGSAFGWEYQIETDHWLFGKWGA